MRRLKHTNVKHNDRDGIKETHIDENKTPQNRYWNLYNGAYSGRTKKEHLSFREAEVKAYQELFGESIKEINEKAIKSRHKDRLTSAEKMLKNERTMPQETIWQIGSTRNQVISISEAWIIWNEFVSWHKKNFPNICILDYALHCDEAYPHIHMRQCYFYHDKYGIKKEGQEKALEEMKIQLPNPQSPRSRYNNRKMTYTKMCTEKLREIAKEHGFIIAETPLKQKHNLSKEEAIVQELKKEQEGLRKKMKYANKFEEIYSQALEDAEEEIEREYRKKKQIER